MALINVSKSHLAAVFELYLRYVKKVYHKEILMRVGGP